MQDLFGHATNRSDKADKPKPNRKKVHAAKVAVSDMPALHEWWRWGWEDGGTGWSRDGWMWRLGLFVKACSGHNDEWADKCKAAIKIIEKEIASEAGGLASSSLLPSPPS